MFSPHKNMTFFNVSISEKEKDFWYQEPSYSAPSTPQNKAQQGYFQMHHLTSPQRPSVKTPPADIYLTQRHTMKTDNKQEKTQNRFGNTQ